MASLLNTMVLDALQSQIDSSCINKEMFTVNIQLMRSLCESFDTQMANMQSQIDSVQRELDLCNCGNGNGGGGPNSDIYQVDEISDQGDNITINTGQFGTECSVGATVDLSMVGQNADDNNPAAFPSWTGTVVATCDGVQIGSSNFSLIAGPLNNGEAFNETTTVTIPNALCSGNYVLTIVPNNKTPSGVATIEFTADAEVAGNCTG